MTASLSDTANGLAIETELTGDRRDRQSLSMKIKNHDDFPKPDHRTAPSFWAEQDWVIEFAAHPQGAPWDGRHDQLGNFQTALLGELLRHQHGPRDAAAILLAYRHGLRAAELCQLRWSQIDLRHGRLHVNRAKGGCASVHPLHGPELRALRPLQGESPYVFVTEAGTPVTPACFLRMVQRTGRAAKLPFPVHPHMLRHSTGYKLANDGHDTRSLAHYLGHRNLQSTARYTALAPDRFKGFWRD